MRRYRFLQCSMYDGQDGLAVIAFLLCCVRRPRHERNAHADACAPRCHAEACWRTAATEDHPLRCNQATDQTFSLFDAAVIIIKLLACFSVSTCERCWGVRVRCLLPSPLTHSPPPPLYIPQPPFPRTAFPFPEPSFQTPCPLVCARVCS